MRNGHKQTWESFNSSKSDTNIIPPWCSSRKLSRRKLVPKCEIQSSYPVRENIWEYLYDGNFKSGKTRRKVCKPTRWKIKLAWIIFSLLFAITAYLWRINAIPTNNLMDKRNLPTKLFSFVNWKPSVSEACCHKMRYLSLELSRAEHKLRNALRQRRAARVPEWSTDWRYIEGAVVTTGSDTVEWGSRVALWGIVPLWKATPPPDTVLSQRNPKPADCWPLSGSTGALNIQLPYIQQVSSISIEHVRPDTANSAPKNFTIYGILANNTLVWVMDNQYQQNGPPKQYYAVRTNGIRSIIFRVLSNHGNVKYTCIYRIHLYGDNAQRNVL